MMENLPSLPDLIQLIEETRPNTNPLQLLTDAVVVSGRLADVGDEVVGHFVEGARSSGATWAEIGECMGVSKQAAQKRFPTGGPGRAGRSGFFLTRLAEDARHVVRRAVNHARRTGSSHVETEHLVLGLLDDPDSRASRAIAGLEGSVEDIRSAAHSGHESGRTSPGGGHIPFSPDAKKVLELALREAIRSSDRRIGTEHILLGILRDTRSPGAQILVDRGITHKTVVAWMKGA
jgi:hypothetical protein